MLCVKYMHAIFLELLLAVQTLDREFNAGVVSMSGPIVRQSSAQFAGRGLRRTFAPSGYIHPNNRRYAMY